MSWIKVKDGYVNTKAIEAVRRSNYLYDNKYRLILDTIGGNTYIANEYDTAKECEKAIKKIVEKLTDIETSKIMNQFINDENLGRCNPNW